MQIATALVALVLAVAALAVGIVALTTGGGTTEETLHLIEEREDEQPLDVGREPALTYGSPISGDERGELVGVCLPVGENGIGCESTFFLPGGTITTQNARLLDESEITSPIVGGTGAYDGAGGTHTIPDPDSGRHTR
ncbi:MAG: hypothetical protein ACRDMA_06895 [Solirubrobacterales bacterium]